MRYKLLSRTEFFQAVNRGGAMIVDLRPPEAYAQWHVPGAVNKDYDNIQEWASHLDPSIPILLYCSYGNDSILAARYLSNRGYYVGSLIGGIKEHHG